MPWPPDSGCDRRATAHRDAVQLVNDVMVPVLRAVEAGFTAEFDYRLEASNLRKMIREVLPLCRAEKLRVDFPAPYDLEHPNLPPALRAKGQPLATKRLMVMDRCNGASLSKVRARPRVGAAGADRVMSI